MGNKKNSISEEEYVYAALQLYVDVVQIFLAILQIAGAIDQWDVLVDAMEWWCFRVMLVVYGGIGVSWWCWWFMVIFVVYSGVGVGGSGV